MKKTLIMCTALLVAGGAAAQSKITYPKAKTVDTVDDYFGTKVADPIAGSRTTIAPKPKLG